MPLLHSGVAPTPLCNFYNHLARVKMMKQLLLAPLLYALTFGAYAQSTELAISNLQVVPEADGLSAITGTAINESGHTLSGAFINFNLYDDTGALVGNATTSASNLAPEDRWNFKAEPGIQFRKAKLTQIQVMPAAP